MSLTAVSQQSIRTGSDAPSYVFRVEGEDIVPESLEVTYSASDGTSDIALTLPYPTEELEGERVRLWLGYGSELVPYFAGELAEPDGNSANAWGPFKAMASQYLLEQVSYVGRTIDAAFWDLVQRAGYGRSQVEIHQGRRFVIKSEEGVFPLETKIGEAASALAEAANFVYFDAPGRDGGKRIFMPTPKPGGSGPVATYDESNMMAFSSKPSPSRKLYSQVVVFRREESGSLAWPAVRIPIETEGKKPRKNQAFLIPEFPGDYQDAQAEALRVAELYRQGTYEISAEFAVNPDLSLYDTLKAEVVERDSEGERYERTYRYLLDGEIKASLTNESRSMSVSGTGIRLKSRKLPKRFFPPRKGWSIVGRKAELVAGLTAAEDLEPAEDLSPSGERWVTYYEVDGQKVYVVPTGVTWDDERTFEELGDYTFEELS